MTPGLVLERSGKVLIAVTVFGDRARGRDGRRLRIDLTMSCTEQRALLYKFGGRVGEPPETVTPPDLV